MKAGGDDVKFLSVPKDEVRKEVERMIDEYGNTVLRLAYMYLRDRHKAEDAFQEVFIKVFKKYRGFKGDSNEKTWITRITINVCKDFYKSSWFKKTILKNDVELSDNNESIDDKMAKDENNHLLYNAVLDLNKAQKDVILLYYYVGHDIREISKILRIPEGTVRSRMYRGREILRFNLKERVDLSV